jgi:uncharacterized membrane protein
MSSATVVLTLVSALGCGLVAGVFFAFSTFVMSALGRLPAAQGIAAMNAINVTVITPLFMLALFGTALTSLAAGVTVLLDWDSAYGPYVLVAAGLYLLGVVALTKRYHVPRNDALARVDGGDPDAQALWSRYLSEWTRANHVRTLAPLVACGLDTVALYVS